MKRYLKTVALITGILMLMSACGAGPSIGTGGQENTEPGNESATAGTEAGTAVTVPSDVDFAQSDSEMFTDRDLSPEYEESESVLIQLSGNSAICGSASVKVSGSTVTITDAGTYVITGTLDDGMIVVNADAADKLHLILKNASVSSKTSAPLYILSADKVFVTLKSGTENKLCSGDSFVAVDENQIDGAVYSKQDLTFNGAGKLTIDAPAGHGIVCKDDLVLAGGTYVIGSASHGIDANDSVRIGTAEITVDAGKDGIHCENADDGSKGFVYISGGMVNIEAEGDGISALAYAQIAAGTVDILAGGGSENGYKVNSESYGDFMGGGMGGGPGGGGRPGGRSATTTENTGDEGTSMKGIKAEGSLLISGGTLQIDSADDTLHANGSVTVTGGHITLKSGDDGIHADEKLIVTGCAMEIKESYEGLEALEIYISGGDIKLKASDDGLNAAGGTDSSGDGGRDQMFGGMGRPSGGGMGRPAGGGMGGSSNGYVEISGGSLYINSSGDGIDANGSFLISGGYTVVVGPTTGDTATLDYDREGKITGGTFIGTGSSMMAQTFSSAEQGVFAVRVRNQSAGTLITLENADGKKIFSYEPELPFAVVILSSPDVISGQQYTITIGATSRTFEAG